MTGPAPIVAGRPDVLDLRLAVAAGAGWLAVIWALSRAASTTLIVALASAAIAVAALALRSAHVRGLAMAGFVVALLLLPLAARQHVARGSQLWMLAADRAGVTLELQTTSDPSPLATRDPSGTQRVAVDAKAVALQHSGKWTSQSGAVLVLADADAWSDILPGQRVRVDARLSLPLDASSLAVTVSATGPPVLLGRPPWYQRMAGSVRSALRSACSDLPSEVRGLLPGLIDGDTSQLDPVLREHFRLAGLTHLVAVSGTNCAILLGAVLFVLRRMRARPAVCAVAGLFVLAGFVLVARPSPSVLRAAAMGVVTLAGLATGRPRSALPALGAATIALLLYSPALAIDAGFAMSVLATAALLVIAPRWVAALQRRRVPTGLAEPLAVAAAAHLVTAPIVAAMSGTVSLSAIPANVLAEPLVAPATILGFAAALVAPWWLTAARVLTWTAAWPCRWLITVADHLGPVRGATLPWLGGTLGGLALAALVVTVALLARSLTARAALAAVAVVCVAIQVPVRQIATTWPPSGWQFVVCDVGQGDGLVLSAGRGSAVVIDSGPDPVPMDRCLSDLGIHDVPLLVFTHFHLDHVGGIAGVLRGRHVQRILVGPLADPEGGVELVHAALRAAGDAAVPIDSPLPGQTFTAGQVRLDVLGPLVTLHDTHSDPNNASLVMRATVGGAAGTRILLPGDAEVEEEQTLLDAGVDLRADVLKVPHHGSAYSLMAFLAAAHAKVALISCGLHNDYGHPAPTTLARLASLGIPTRRTDLDGDIAVSGPPNKLTVLVRGKASSAAGR